MPKKQNGFGNSKSLAFKPSKAVSKGKGVGAPGLYPSDRRYGSSVQRTIIEQYNLDSNWVKWRRGFEYYNKSAWYRLKDYDPITQTYSDSQIESKLYQGTDYEIDVIFEGYKFATKHADSNNHYVIKRIPLNNNDIGRITGVLNDPFKYSNFQASGEIRTSIVPGKDADVLFQMIGDRITDGETTATLDFILTGKDRPAVFLGKSWPEQLTTITSSLNKAKVMASPWLKERNSDIQQLVGKVVYIPQLFIERDINNPKKFDVLEARDYWGIRLVDDGLGEIQILDNDTDFPSSIYDINNLEPIVKDTAGVYEIQGTYLYQKELYQRFYGQQYLTGELALEDVVSLSYSVMPYVILGVEEVDSRILIKSVPFLSELKLYSELTNAATLIFRDKSFTKMEIDEYDGNYYHQAGAPGDKLWMRLDIDVDPWMDEVFANGTALQPADTYTCSCPSFAKTMLSAPQETQDEGTRRINRQRRYPLPTAKGRSDFDQIGMITTAGKAESWENREDRRGFRCCKHTIAAMFIENLKVKEPNSYPTVTAREAFEDKLAKDIAEVGEEFVASYKRGGLTTLEVVFALAQGLNLDDVETAYVVLNSKF